MSQKLSRWRYGLASLCMLGGLLVSSMVFAANVPNLYQATVQVAANSATPQSDAAQAALQAVLIKVSGNAQIAQVPAIASQLANATQFTQQINLSTNSYTVSFDPTSINQLLTQAQQPVWGSDRPLVLGWIGIQQPGQAAALLSSSSSGSLPVLLTQTASTRGLPFILPVLDLQDLSIVSVNDVMSDATSVIQSASNRYAADAILIGRVTAAPAGGWQGQWSLVMGQQEKDWQTTNADLNTLVVGALNDTANAIVAAAVSAQAATGASDHLLIKVTGAQGMTGYASVMDYLKNLPSVNNVQVVQLSSTSLEFQVSVSGGAPAFEQAVSLNPKMVAVGTSGAVVANANLNPPATSLNTSSPSLPEPQFGSLGVNNLQPNAPVMEYQWQG